MKKQAKKEGPVRDEAALTSLRRREYAEFDEHKEKLRRELESAMASAADKDLLRGLRRAEADLRALSPEQVRARSHPPRLSQQHRAPCSAVMRVCVPASAASTGLLVSLATHPWIVCYPLLAARLRRRGT